MGGWIGFPQVQGLSSQVTGDLFIFMATWLLSLLFLFFLPYSSIHQHTPSGESLFGEQWFFLLLFKKKVLLQVCPLQWSNHWNSVRIFQGGLYSNSSPQIWYFFSWAHSWTTFPIFLCSLMWPCDCFSKCYVPIPSLPCFLCLDANLEVLGNSEDTNGKSLGPRIACRGELSTDENHLSSTLPEGEITCYVSETLHILQFIIVIQFILTDTLYKTKRNLIFVFYHPLKCQWMLGNPSWFSGLKLQEAPRLFYPLLGNRQSNDSFKSYKIFKSYTQFEICS